MIHTAITSTRDPLDATAIYDCLVALQDASTKAERRRSLAMYDDDLMDALDRAMFDARKALAAQLRLAGINPALLADVGGR